MQNGTWFTQVNSCLRSHLVWCTPTIHSHWLAVLQMKQQGVFLFENMSWQHIVDSIHFFYFMTEQLECPAKNWKAWFHQSPPAEVTPHLTSQKCHKYWPENDMDGGTIHCSADVVLLYEISFNFRHQWSPKKQLFKCVLFNAASDWMNRLSGLGKFTREMSPNVSNNLPWSKCMMVNVHLMEHDTTELSDKGHN